MEPVPSRFFSSYLIGRKLLLTNEKGSGEIGPFPTMSIFPTHGKRDENRSHPENILFIRQISAIRIAKSGLGTSLVTEMLHI